MGIEEFKRTLEVIENEWNNKSRAYTEQKYFIYIKNDLRSSYVEKTLRTRCMDNIRYIIVIGSYISLEGYRNESLRTIGFLIISISYVKYILMIGIYTIWILINLLVLGIVNINPYPKLKE